MLFQNAIRNKTKSKAIKKPSTFCDVEEAKLNRFKPTRDKNEPVFGSLLATKDEEIAKKLIASMFRKLFHEQH